MAKTPIAEILTEKRMTTKQKCKHEWRLLKYFHYVTHFYCIKCLKQTERKNI